MAKRKKNIQEKRPIAVTVIAAAIVVLFLIRLYQVYEPLARENIFKNGITGPLFNGFSLTPLGSLLATSLGYLVLSLAGIVVLFGFLRLRSWSWVLLMAWTGLSLIVSLVDYIYSKPNYIVMASNVIIAFALNFHEVQRIFNIRRDRGPSI